jgi:5-hydroxyisourate hydrolase
MGLSTHILDTALGRPAAAVEIRLLAREADGGWSEIGAGRTDADGRCKTLLGERALAAGEYKLRFATAAYFAAMGVESLYREIEIAFVVRDAAQYYHIPLLLAANGYTTYRGS